jgi:hypothetical protein
MAFVLLRTAYDTFEEVCSLIKWGKTLKMCPDLVFCGLSWDAVRRNLTPIANHFAIGTVMERINKVLHCVCSFHASVSVYYPPLQNTSVGTLRVLRFHGSAANPKTKNVNIDIASSQIASFVTTYPSSDSDEDDDTPPLLRVVVEAVAEEDEADDEDTVAVVVKEEEVRPPLDGAMVNKWANDEERCAEEGNGQ